MATEIASADPSGQYVPVSAASPLPVKQSAVVNGVETSNTLVAAFRRPDAFHAPFNSADASTAAQLKAGTTGKSIYITDLMISVGAAISVKLQDNSGTPNELFPSIYMAATTSIHKTFSTPVQVAAAKDLNVLASGAGNITVVVGGYVI